MYLLVVLLIVFMIIIWLWSKKTIDLTQKKMLDSFKSLSFDISQQNNRSFLDLAKITLDKYQEGLKGEFDNKQKSIESLLNPVKESLNKIDEYSRQIEKQREGAYSALNKQLENLIVTENNLRSETSNLVKALRSPNVRGSWGQIHLRRVVELAGMLNNCDFFEQASAVGEDRSYRPDLIVRLPGDRQIIIDAKTPIEAYLEAAELPDEMKKEKLKTHALQIKKHMKDLSSKEYWKQFDPTPEYVILFLPAEAFFSSALDIDPTLLEQGALKNIIIATPTTLIAILKAIAFGWKQESMSKSAKEIARIGKELHERLTTMNSHFSKLGKSISSSVDAYNQAISSFESRVLVSARKLKEMGISSDKSDETLLEEVNKTTRSLYIDKIE